MNKTLLLSFVTWTSVFMCTSVLAQQKQYGLQDVIQLAKDQSPFSKQAETRKENRYWQYRSYKTNYNPQLRLSGQAPGFNRETQEITQPDGTISYPYVNITNSIGRLSLEQPISLTGGQISINTNLNYTENNLTAVSLWRGDPVNISYNQPLLAFNQLRWDRKIEPIRYEESKRSYVEEMEFISRNSVDRFFNVLDAQINLQIASFNLANNDTIYKIEEGRYNIGTTTRDKLLQAELQLLRSRQDVTQAKINLQDAKLQLRSYMGLRDSSEFQLILPESIPGLLVTIDEALSFAKENRSGYLAFERRKIEAEREVALARGQQYDVNLRLTYGLSNAGGVLSDVYNDPLAQQAVNLTFSAPIIDWGRNKARMQTAIANKKLNDYIIAQDEVDFEQEIITLVRQFEVLLSQIEITKKSDEVAQERYMVSQNRYLIGKIDITNLNIALNEKDTAKRSYLSALRAFWTAYYDLRRLTLYDFSNRRLLYTPEE